MNEDELPLTRQTWRNQIALHWEVSRQDLRPLVPPELEPATFDGTCWLTLAAFEVTRVDLAGILPAPPLQPFFQIEVRTLVENQGAKGVWYLTMDASSSTVAAAARFAFGLPYQNAEIVVGVEGTEEVTVSVKAKRESRDPVTCSLKAVAEGVTRPLEAGSFEEMLLAPRVCWTEGAEGLRRIEMEREPVRVSKARVIELHEMWTWIAGIPRRGAVPLAHFIRESTVAIAVPAP